MRYATSLAFKDQGASVTRLVRLISGIPGAKCGCNTLAVTAMAANMPYDALWTTVAFKAKLEVQAPPAVLPPSFTIFSQGFLLT